MRKSIDLIITPQLKVNLPLIHVEEKPLYYSFNLLGHSKWNRLIASELVTQYQKSFSPDLHPILMTVEAKAIGLTEQIAHQLEIDSYVVVRKNFKSYMKHPISFQGSSITSGNNQYWIDDDDISQLKNRLVILCDDVISTGGTMETLIKIIHYSQAKPLVILCGLTEGSIRSEFMGIPLFSCGYLPLPQQVGVLHD